MKHERLVETIGLPQNLEAERLVLGQVLITGGDAFPSLAEIVTGDAFTTQQHRLIWQAMTNMHAAGTAIDRVSLYHELSEAGLTEAVGGLTTLVELDADMPALSHPEQYAVIIAEIAEKRQALKVLDAAMTQILSGDPIQGTLTQLAGHLSNVGQVRDGDAPVRIGDALAAIGIDSLISPVTDRPGAIRLPWQNVQELIPALEPTQLMILAARPGLGKTAAGVQIGIYAALQGHGVLMFSLEMGIDEIVSRMIAERGQVNMHKFACGWKPSEVERSSIHRAAAELADLDFHLDRQLNRTGAAISRAVRKHVRKYPNTRLVIVDYLQLAGNESARSNRNEQISEITRGLKLLAMELNIVILALSQLSRDSEKAERPPRLSDLRDSGAIEQDANIVAFLHNRNGGRDTDQPTSEIDFIVAKNRKGALRTRTLTFLRNTTTFIDGKED